MSFTVFNKNLKKHVAKMTRGQNHLFTVYLTKESVWDTYLDSFPEGTNEIYRERREFDCNCCRHFIRDFGRVVSIKDQKITTIWDFKAGSEQFQPVVDALSALIKSAQINEFYMPEFGNPSIGTAASYEELDDGGYRTWNHLSVPMPSSLHLYTKDEIGSKRGLLRDSRNVFERSLKEINPDAVSTVQDLIAQNALYKGAEWKTTLTKFAKFQKEYINLSSAAKANLYCWEMSAKAGISITKIKNHSMGVLLTDVSEGMDLDKAVKRYEKIVAPSNYKRPKAIFTKKMVEQAQETVKDLGFEDSLGRRFAQMDDITVNNILFANRNAKKAMTGNIFDELADSVPQKPKNLSKLTEIHIDKFIEDVLPTASEVEVLLENNHSGNMVSLIAPTAVDSKSMLKWDNNFSWAYSGNITDSMKQNVKSAGGKVDGELRFSIQWNDNGDNRDDLDAHCIEPCGNEIFFSRRDNHRTTGNLDVDITTPGTKVAVENITWSDRSRMGKGNYKFFVHNYSKNGGTSGFTAEIEYDGTIHTFEYPSALKRKQTVAVAAVDFEGTTFKNFKPLLNSNTQSKDIWELPSNRFHKVSVAMHSPNYWNDQDGIGNKHYFFMLDGCTNPETPNGFFNEFLQESLTKHKRVFEALGSKMKVADAEGQLSGLGFSSTKRAHVVCKVKGSFERMLKVTF